MKIVRVQYTVRADFAATNQRNIAAVAEQIKSLGLPGIKYTAWLLLDGKTFMHFDQLESEEAHLALQDLPSFKKFADELEASGLEIEPRMELLGFVASTETYF
jgi:hypothetical protein